MADPTNPGRMIRTSIATHRGIAKLGPEATAVFTMILPHLNAHGKMLGEPAIVKEIALPFARWATLDVIEKSLREINRYTNVKWFRAADGRHYIHALSWEKHQSLELKKRGIDHLPSRKSTSSRRVVDEKSASGRRPNEKLKLNDNENANGNEKGNENKVKGNTLSPHPQGKVPTNGAKPPRDAIIGMNIGEFRGWWKAEYGKEPPRHVIGCRTIAIERALADLGYEHLSTDEQMRIPETWN